LGCRQLRQPVLNGEWAGGGINWPRANQNGQFRAQISQSENFIFFLLLQHLAETNLIGLDMGHPDGVDCTSRGLWDVCDERRDALALHRRQRISPRTNRTSVSKLPLLADSPRSAGTSLAQL
jgi:hypothetical protein